MEFVTSGISLRLRFLTILRKRSTKLRKNTLLKFYKALEVPTPLYGSEIWTLANVYCKRIQAAEETFWGSVIAVLEKW